MLLELCKSAVHIMFSDMCLLERERESKGESGDGLLEGG